MACRFFSFNAEEIVLMHLMILGCRGVPSRHGGFETFAQDLSLFLAARNHEVTVYCQALAGSRRTEDMWHGVRRVFIAAGDGSLGTIQFDWASVRHASREKGVVLTLGYNTGVFNYLLRMRGIPSVMNMDGLEWKRVKWSGLPRTWLWLNEIGGAAAANHLVADHPEISRHLQRHTSPSKITVIPYGADPLLSASAEPLEQFGLQSKSYYLVIARPEPDNSILEIVRGYSRRPRAAKLVVLGNYQPGTTPYHQSVVDAASSDVKFAGAVYDREVVKSLRYHAMAYIHGHRVGGTNPSLVEALGAGNAVIAHDNRFTRWVAGEHARYFADADQLAVILDALEADPSQLARMEQESRLRHEQTFEQERVLAAYEALLARVAERATVEDAPATFGVGGIDGTGILSAHQWAHSLALGAQGTAEGWEPDTGNFQRRAAVRYKLRVPVTFHWNDGVEHSADGFTSDLAANGVLILSHRLPPVDTPIRIEVFAPVSGTGERAKIECFGRVARVVEHTEQSAFGVHGIFDHEHLAHDALVRA
jgi:glycosyltransferase involved in cell wall biosynthesis